MNLDVRFEVRFNRFGSDEELLELSLERIVNNDLHNSRAEIILRAAQLAAEGDRDAGEQLINAEWAHNSIRATKRTNTKADRLKRFLADGFVCRYSGQRLLFLPLLEVLSILWPTTFPWHPNWKSDVTHDAYWSHSASLDHIDPVAVGGAESWGNWATTSAARNQVRSRFSLNALGWRPDVGRPTEGWDGGVSLFRKLMEVYQAEIARSERARHLSDWYSVVEKVLGESKHQGS